MGIERTNSIEGLVSTNPVIGDPVHEGTEHFWLIKKVLKLVFPGKAGQGYSKPITATEDDLNSLTDVAGTVVTVGTHTYTFSTLKQLVTDVYTYLVNLNTFAAELDARVQAMYPVGSIYLNANNGTNPATLLGFGTWAPVGQGRMLVGFSGGDALFGTAEQQGGWRDACLVGHNHSGSTNGAGNHSHTVEGCQQINGQGGAASNMGGPAGRTTSVNGDHTHSFTTSWNGEDATNRNIPPYYTVFIWKRTG